MLERYIHVLSIYIYIYMWKHVHTCKGQDFALTTAMATHLPATPKAIGYGAPDNPANQTDVGEDGRSLHCNRRCTSLQGSPDFNVCDLQENSMTTRSCGKTCWSPDSRWWPATLWTATVLRLLVAWRLPVAWPPVMLHPAFA